MQRVCFNVKLVCHIVNIDCVCVCVCVKECFTCRNGVFVSFLLYRVNAHR